MTSVKICGLTDDDGVESAVAVGATWIGFVFFPASPRAVTPERAGELLDGVPFADEGGPLRVGLVVDPDDELVERIVSAVRLDLLQLHGSETPERVDEIRDMTGLPVIKALAIATRDDLKTANAYADSADYLLLDARPPKDADRPGGNALAFDWSLTEGWVSPLPWILAGGLTVDTVAEAIRLTGAGAVDVSSGVESSPGVKDPAKIAAFIAAARREVR